MGGVARRGKSDEEDDAVEDFDAEGVVEGVFFGHVDAPLGNEMGEVKSNAGG